MDITAAPTSITDLIAAVGSELTPKERRLAKAVLAEPTLLAFGTVSDLAHRVKASRPTVVRFANKLGFDGYTELQRHVRHRLTQRLARPSERIRRGDEVAQEARTAVEGAVHSVFGTAKRKRMHDLVAPIVAAQNVWVLSGETSRAGAHAFHGRLSILRPGVRWLEEHSLSTDLSGAGSGDTAVIFDFHRYRRRVVTAARTLADAGVAVVAITDSPLSPLVEPAVAWCEIEIPAIGPFDSSVPVVAMAELLVSRVAREIHDNATARIDRIEALWATHEVFV
jgi:DNA-binding MurR/RpiR family transcriptional regulator